MTLCFKSNGKPDLEAMPDWLAVEYSFAANEPRFYSVWVVPWIGEVAIALRGLKRATRCPHAHLGTLDLDGSVAGWIAHLESLGFDDVVQVSCCEFFGARADRDR